MSAAQWSKIVARHRMATKKLRAEIERRRAMAKLCPNCGEPVKRKSKSAIFCTDLCCTEFHARKRKGERRVVRTIRRSSSSRLPL